MMLKLSDIVRCLHFDSAGSVPDGMLDATSDPTRITFRFDKPLKPGKYMLVAGTRAGQGRDYRLRIVRTPINVLG